MKTLLRKTLVLGTILIATFFMAEESFSAQQYEWGTINGSGYPSTPVANTSITGLIATNNAIASSELKMVIKADGTLWGWGSNTMGQLGIGNYTSTTTPTQAIGMTDVIDVESSFGSTIALKSNGTVWTTGNNGYGILGLGSPTPSNYNTFTQVPGLTDVISVSTEGLHMMTLKKDGTVWSWGQNDHGQMGQGYRFGNFYSPTQVPGITNAVAIGTSGFNQYVLTSDGEVYGWGNDTNGAVGTGSVSPTWFELSPVLSSELGSDIKAIAPAYHSILALKTDGTVWGLGYNALGQLGNGTTTSSPTATQVTGLTGVKEITIGQYHSMALKSDGTLWSWGINSSGQLGDNTTTNQTTPVQVLGVGGVGYLTGNVKLPKKMGAYTSHVLSTCL